MKIVISGYGRMGHEVEKIATGRGHTIIDCIDNNAEWEAFLNSGQPADVAIDFSTPSSALNVAKHCLSAGLNLICGTTGLGEKVGEITALYNQSLKAFFYAPNFSIGVNILFEINRKLASLVADYNYTGSIHEIHHIHKLDAPSGTAIALANDIVDRNPKVLKWASGNTADNYTLPVISERTGEVPGTHSIVWQSAVDRIELSHVAFNRTGFASGAVLAAEWLMGKQGSFTMTDLLSSGSRIDK